MKHFFMIIAMLVLAACGPRGDEELPTLARLPTITEGPSPTVDLTQVALARTPLPATFTPTYTATMSLTPDPSVTATLTETITVTPSSTITDTPTRTPTPLPTLHPDERPILAFAFTAAAATILPPDFVVPPYEGINVTLSPEPLVFTTLPPGVPSAIPPLNAATQVPAPLNCTFSPQAGFATIYTGNPDIAAQLGCAIDGSAAGIPAAWQQFEQGIMVWLNGEILIFYSISDSYQNLPDTFVSGVDPETSSEVPPAGLLAPVRGFLKVWAGNSAVRNGLGWAITSEMGVNATVTEFQYGRMIWLPGRSSVLVLIGTQGGTWLSFQGQF